MGDEAWKQSRLWREIEARHDAGDPAAEKVATFVEGSLPNIVKILNSGGTPHGLSDFTLHDADHSARVVKWMERLPPEETFSRLSVHELGLLLLSAHLHDIGMSPSIGLVWRHFNYLLNGETGGNRISDTDAAAMSGWLAEFDPNYTIPLTPDQLQEHDQVTDCAAYLTAYYCRHRHNDWSGDWITRNLTGNQPYAAWNTDLIALCQSHHWSRDDLDKLVFRHVPGTSEPVNLRYLSMLLRVADVIEVDPERVPECIREHREVSRTSIDYWLKDLWPAVNIEQTQGGRIIRFEATPPRARLHHALEQTAAQIDAELALARTLADEGWFAKGNIGETERCKWDLPYRVHSLIEALPDTYEYINGSFRPNTRKVLELLSGTNLYGDRFAAVRELIQNAFDAVRWCVADRLLKEHERDPTLDPESARLKFGDTHRVSLRLEQDREKRWWLECRDDGRGMTKRVIETQVLVSGNSQRGELKMLEARCQKAGFSSEVTAQFGIGMLSYFMLADRVEIVTKRRGGDPAAKGGGWRFETDGIGTFGELRKAPHCDEGTSIRLRLKDRDVTTLSAAIRDALIQEVVFSPCHLDYTGTGGDQLSMPPGWTRNLSHYVPDLVGKIDTNSPPSGNFISSEHSRKEQEEEERVERWHTEDCRHVALFHEEKDLLRTATGTIVGRYRILMPYFQFPDGASLASLHLRDISFNLSAFKDHAQFCWKGIAFQAEALPNATDDLPLQSGYGRLIEIDLTANNGNKVMVDRNTVLLSRETIRCLLPILARCDDLTERMFQSAIQGRKYHEISRVLLKERGFCSPFVQALPPGDHWPHEREGKVCFDTLPFPITTSIRWGIPRSLWWCDQNITSTTHGSDFHGAWAFGYPPSRLLAVVGGGRITSVIALWESLPHNHSPLNAAPFPPEWNDVITVTGREGYSNANHPLVQVLPPDIGVTIRPWLETRQDAQTVTTLLDSPDVAIAVFIRWLASDSGSSFCSLLRDAPHDIAEKWWNLVSKEGAIPLRFADLDGDVYELCRDGSRIERGELPVPQAPEWRASVVHPE